MRTTTATRSNSLPSNHASKPSDGPLRFAPLASRGSSPPGALLLRIVGKAQAVCFWPAVLLLCVAAAIGVAKLLGSSWTAAAGGGGGGQHAGLGGVDEQRLWRSMKCDSEDPAAIAKTVLSYWVNIASPSQQELLKSAPLAAAAAASDRHVEAILKEQKLLSDKDYCLYKVQYDAFSRIFRVEERNLTCTSYGIRADVLSMFLTVLAKTRKGMLNSYVDFTFYFDPTAATRDTPRLFRALGHPVLSLSRSLTERSTIPVPHYHSLLGMYQMYPKNLLLALPKSLRAASVNYHKINTFQTPCVPWAERLNKAVFRSNCFPTMSPYSSNPNDYLFLRSDLCRAWSSHPLFDIGTYHDLFDLCRHKALEAMCTGCRKCVNITRLDRGSMARYKYHINTDGFGAASDATFWKLSGGSLLIWQLPDNDTSPAWVPWYWPAVQPFQDFIPAPTRELGSTVEFCIHNDGACKKIAESGRRTMVCKVNVRVATEYYVLLMQYLQCLAGQRDVLKCRMQLGV